MDPGLPSNFSVTDLYNSVMEQTVNSCRAAFLDEGVTEEVLQELKQLWIEELIKNNPDPVISFTHKPQQVNQQLEGVENDLNSLPSVLSDAATGPISRDDKIPIQVTSNIQSGDGTISDGQRSITITVPLWALNSQKLHEILKVPAVQATLSLPSHEASSKLQEQVDLHLGLHETAVVPEEDNNRPGPSGTSRQSSSSSSAVIKNKGSRANIKVTGSKSKTKKSTAKEQQHPVKTVTTTTTTTTKGKGRGKNKPKSPTFIVKKPRVSIKGKNKKVSIITQVHEETAKKIKAAAGRTKKAKKEPKLIAKTSASTATPRAGGKKNVVNEKAEEVKEAQVEREAEMGESSSSKAVKMLTGKRASRVQKQQPVRKRKQREGKETPNVNDNNKMAVATTSIASKPKGRGKKRKVEENLGLDGACDSDDDESSSGNDDEFFDNHRSYFREKRDSDSSSSRDFNRSQTEDDELEDDKSEKEEEDDDDDDGDDCQVTYDEGQDGLNNHNNEDGEEDILEDQEGGGEDSSEDEDDEENLIVCQYDKITRVRNKWKFELKDGILSLNGKDYIFHKANGDSEF